MVRSQTLNHSSSAKHDSAACEAGKACVWSCITPQRDTATWKGDAGPVISGTQGGCPQRPDGQGVGGVSEGNAACEQRKGTGALCERWWTTALCQPLPPDLHLFTFIYDNTFSAGYTLNCQPTCSIHTCWRLACLWPPCRTWSSHLSLTCVPSSQASEAIVAEEDEDGRLERQIDEIDEQMWVIL